MATRTNIGKLRDALSDALAAKRSLNTGPYVDPMTVSSRYNMSIADFGASERVTDGFIFGIDKWGDKTRKVTKR